MQGGLIEVEVIREVIPGRGPGGPITRTAKFIPDNDDPLSDEELRDLFNSYSENGYLTVAGFVNVTNEIFEGSGDKPSYQECLEIMAEFDTNRDGKLNFSEFKQLMNETM